MRKDDIFDEVKKEWEDYLEADKNIDKTKFDIWGYDSDDLLNCYKK
ncbi:MAG: hypothetical protein KAU95_03205 [Candidatus Aenigmarchaeota archaeon]|nr:hypothetical protein [Candidatus Aenigmarchaeota archaeon]